MASTAFGSALGGGAGNSNRPGIGSPGLYATSGRCLIVALTVCVRSLKWLWTASPTLVFIHVTIRSTGMGSAGAGSFFSGDRAPADDAAWSMLRKNPPCR